MRRRRHLPPPRDGTRLGPNPEAARTDSSRGGQAAPTGDAKSVRGQRGGAAGLGVTVAAFMSEYRVGSLREGPRAELIAGRVSTREHPDPAHTAAVLTLEDRMRALRLGEEGVLVVRSPPVRLGPTDLLRPDLALLVDAESAAGRYHARTRGRQAVVAAGVGGSFDPPAVLLAVEVSRGRVSLEERLPLYAVAGVRELWLLDLRRGWTEALRSPWQGLYRSRTLWYPGERVPIVSLAGVMVEPLLSP